MGIMERYCINCASTCVEWMRRGFTNQRKRRKLEMAKGIKTGGRQKGSPNKLTKQLKDMILDALDESGGVEYLKQTAIDHPTAFLTLVGKVLPLQVTGADGGPIQEDRHVTISFVKPE